jgi:hypothetical protein
VTTLPADQPDLDQLKAAILSDVQQDWVGVYEVWWDMNRRCPSVPLSERLATAERIVRELLSEGHIRLYRSAWGAETHETVPDDQAGSLLLKHSSWVPPQPPEPTIWIGPADAEVA